MFVSCTVVYRFLDIDIVQVQVLIIPHILVIIKMIKKVLKLF